MGLFSGITKGLGKIVSSAGDFLKHSGLGGAIGAVTGNPLFSAGMSFLGGMSQNQANMNLAGMNNQQAIDMYKHRYQWQVEDLKAAGLNPILAYGQQPGAVPNLTTPRMENIASSATDSYLKASMAKQNEALLSKIAAETEASRSQSEVNRAMANRIIEETANTAADTVLKKNNSFLVEKQIENFQYGIDKFIAETRLTNTDQQKVLQEITNAIKEGRKIDATTGNINVDTVLKRAQTRLSDMEYKLKGFDLTEGKAKSDYYGSKLGHDLYGSMHGNSASSMVNIGAAVGKNVVEGLSDNAESFIDFIKRSMRERRSAYEQSHRR